jgi:hypothetical protein
MIKHAFQYVQRRETDSRQNLHKYTKIPKAVSVQQLYDYFELFNKYLNRKDDVYWADFCSGNISISNLNCFIKDDDDFIVAITIQDGVIYFNLDLET